MVEPDGYDLPPTQPEWQRWEQPPNGMAVGGVISTDRLVRVGERGPETFIPDTSGRVMVLGPGWEYKTLPSPMRNPEWR